MKRLTDKTDYVLGVYSDMEERLMDIEDILGDEYDLARLRELAQADREGRCVMLPAKPDQIIYQWRKGDDCPSVSRLDGVQINADGEITYPIWCGHLTPGDFGETVFLTREEAALRREQDEKGGGQHGEANKRAARTVFGIPVPFQT